MDSTGRNWFIKNQPQILRTFEKKLKKKWEKKKNMYIRELGTKKKRPKALNEWSLICYARD